MKILVVTFTESPEPSGVDADHIPEGEDWFTELDMVTTLREMGHEVRLSVVYDDLRPVQEEAASFGAEIAFNLVDALRAVSSHAYKAAVYFELLGLPYTGTSPPGLLLAKDKGLTKVILRHHRIRVPDFALHPPGPPVRRPVRLAFPVVIKTLYEDASRGISQRSVATTDEEYQERVAFIHRTFDQPALCERYVHGREIYVAMLGDRRPQIFPLRELSFGNLPADEPRIATWAAKWDDAYRERWKIESTFAEGLDDALVQRIRRVCRRAARALKLDGCVRLDLRVTASGEIFVLEANPNPCLAIGDDYAEAARAGGVDYDALLDRLIRLGLARARRLAAGG